LDLYRDFGLVYIDERMGTNTGTGKHDAKGNSLYTENKVFKI